MKLVLAIIKPHKVDEVREALGAIGVQGLTISEARGYGRQKGHTEIYRGAEYETSLVPKIRLEVVAEDDFAPRVVETIQHAAQTGAIGDEYTDWSLGASVTHKNVTAGLSYVDTNKSLYSSNGRNIAKGGIVASLGVAF